MKKIMELLQNMKAKNEKKDNKGFSLVELIIVIAIMAILVGIVGTQVLPYIEKSRKAKRYSEIKCIMYRCSNCIFINRCRTEG